MSGKKISPVYGNAAVQRPASASGTDKRLPARRCSIGLSLAFAALMSSVFVASSSAQEQAHVAAAVPEESTVVVLGDSNTSGYGVSPQEAYPARLQEKLHGQGRSVRVINAGWPGDTFGAMLNRIDFSVPQNARLVIVQGGYNDLANGVPTDVTIANLESILSRLQARGVKTVVCGFFDKNWDAIGRKLAATHRATFIPGDTCYDPKHVGPDGLHMSATGHEVVAKRLSGVVQQNGARHR